CVSELAVGLGHASNSYISEPRVALLVPCHADRVWERLTGRGDLGNFNEIDVGDRLPGDGGFSELVLPNLRGEPRVESLEERTWSSADARVVRHEAVGNSAAEGPGASQRGVEKLSGLESLEIRTNQGALVASGSMAAADSGEHDTLPESLRSLCAD